ncbi:MAG: hypothetical protein WCL10_04215 [Novosphingobium sp.]|uniref:hypothetical protein n=1 Tax=Novosphingobium sp. TaxID=1874826 RepID=UPI00301A9D9F
MGKSIAVTGLVLLAALSVLSGSDRQSRDFPASPSFIGWPYDTGGARARAIMALVKTGPASAIALARRSILSDPISAPAVSILGRSQLYAAQLPEAHKTFMVAGQLGWRDSMTQIYWLDQAIQAADYRVAAERLDALLRQFPNDENGSKLLALVSAAPEGRDALAARLKLKPAWAESYVTDVKNLPNDQLLQRVDVIRRSGPGNWACRQTSSFAQQLINSQNLDEAQQVWRMGCPSSTSEVYDGGFEQLDTTRPTTGFDWVLSNRGDAEISLVQDPFGHNVLAVEVSATIALPIVRQLVVLKPGSYRLTWRTPDTGATEAQALRVALSCGHDYADAVPGSAVPGRAPTFTHDFVVDGRCPARQLIFWLAPRGRVRLDDIALERI